MKASNLEKPRATFTALQLGHIAADTLYTEFHFGERGAQRGARDSADDGIAFVADDISLISPNDPVQTSATFRRTKR
ncbi:MAG: hypothetical protein ACR2JB_09460 [Bryobacteraceae bacterium]